MNLPSQISSSGVGAAALKTGENLASSVGKNITSVSNTVKAYYVVFFLLLFILVTYGLYIYYSSISTNVLIRNQVFLKNGAITLQNEQINIPSRNSSSYSIWVYLEEKIQNNKKGSIFQLNTGTISSYSGGVLGSNGVFALYIDPSENLLFVNTIDKFTVMTQFPLQKWTNIFINIYEMEYYEFYINGKLNNTFKRSPLSDGVSGLNDITKHYTIVLGGDNPLPKIIISNFKRWAYTHTHPTVWSNYTLENNNDTYNAKISLTSYDGTYKPFILSFFESEKKEEL